MLYARAAARSLRRCGTDALRGGIPMAVDADTFKACLGRFASGDRRPLPARTATMA